MKRFSTFNMFVNLVNASQTGILCFGSYKKTFQKNATYFKFICLLG